MKIGEKKLMFHLEDFTPPRTFNILDPQPNYNYLRMNTLALSTFNSIRVLVLFVLFACVSLQVTSQNLTNPPNPTVGPIIGSDTVCYNIIWPNVIPPEIYSVPDLGEGWSYQWQSVGNIISAQGNDTIYVDWTNNPTAPSGFVPNAVSVIAIDPNGSVSPQASFDITIFYTFPSITPIGPLCVQGECVTLEATPAGGVFSGDGVTGNQFCPQQTNTFSLLPYNNVVHYTYTQSGCSFSTYLPNVLVYSFQEISNIVVQNLTQSYLPNGETLEVCEGDSVHRVYGVAASFQGTNEWTVAGNTTQSPTLDIYWNQWNEPGVYTISVVRLNNQSLAQGGNGCPAEPRTTTVTIECATSVNELIHDVDVWPNPVNGVININTPSPSGVVRIYAVDGSCVYQSNYNSSNFNLDSDFLANGTYVITLIDDRGTFYSRKIIK